MDSDNEPEFRSSGGTDKKRWNKREVLQRDFKIS